MKIGLMQLLVISIIAAINRVVSAQCPTRAQLLTSQIACNSDAMCQATIPGTFCYNGICCLADRFDFCPFGQVKIAGQCLPSANLGQPCQYTAQCTISTNQPVTCLNGLCQTPNYFDSQTALCQQPGAQVEISNGRVKTCLRGNTCSAGYSCEFSTQYLGGQYICCGFGNGGYGTVKMYLNYGVPLQCTTPNSCTFVDTPNCVYSYRYRYSVCCSTLTC